MRDDDDDDDDIIGASKKSRSRKEGPLAFQRLFRLGEVSSVVFVVVVVGVVDAESFE